LEDPHKLKFSKGRLHYVFCADLYFIHTWLVGYSSKGCLCSSRKSSKRAGEAAAAVHGGLGGLDRGFPLRAVLL